MGILYVRSAQPAMPDRQGYDRQVPSIVYLIDHNIIAYHYRYPAWQVKYHSYDTVHQVEVRWKSINDMLWK